MHIYIYIYIYSCILEKLRHLLQKISKVMGACDKLRHETIILLYNIIILELNFVRENDFVGL